MPCRSFRYVIVSLCFFVGFLEYATRVNINNAIVSMVDEVIVFNKTTLSHDYCPSPYLLVNEWSSSNHTAQTTSHQTPETRMRSKGPLVQTYDWSPTTQGLILGAFFYGYMVLQVPAGRFAEILGGKWIVAVGLLISGLVNVLTPWLTYSVPLLTASRVLLGLAQGLILPACFCLIVIWMEPNERSLGFGLVNVGGNLGVVFASAVTGYVSQVYGWPYGFIGLGLLTIAWTLSFWLCFVRSQPQPEEVGILRCDTGSSSNSSSLKGSIKSMACRISTIESASTCETLAAVKTPVPWIAIMTNQAVLSAGLSRFCGTFGYLTLQTKLPAYLESVLHESASDNGMLNSFLFLATSIMMALGPFLSEILISRHWLSRTHTRKLFTCIAQYSLTICFLLLPAIGCSASHSIFLLVLGMLMYGLVMGGDVIIPAEISPTFATTIFSCINMFANSAGVVAPLVIGLLLEGAQDGVHLKHKWDSVFYMAAGVVSFGTTVFLLFGTSDRQDFDRNLIRLPISKRRADS